MGSSITWRDGGPARRRPQSEAEPGFEPFGTVKAHPLALLARQSAAWALSGRPNSFAYCLCPVRIDTINPRDAEDSVKTVFKLATFCGLGYCRPGIMKEDSFHRGT